MAEMATITVEALAQLEARVQELTAANAHLQVLIHWINQLGPASGLDDVIETLLRNVNEAIGGSQLSLYYWMDGTLHCADVSGQRRVLQSLDDPRVAEVVATRAPAEHPPNLRAGSSRPSDFSQAFTWIVPLQVGLDLIGVIKIENAPDARRALAQQWPAYWGYAALVLNQAIAGQTRLDQACADLAREAAARQQAEADLRQAKAVLDERVAEHAAALQARESHFQSLLRLSKNLEQAQTYGQALEAARAEVQALLGYQNLWVYLFTDDKRHAKSLVAGGDMSDTIMSETGTATLTIAGDPMLEEIVAARDIVVVEDARTDPRTNKAIVASMGILTLINAPIILFERHLGSVGTGTFGNEGVRAPTETEKEYLRALASHMAVTLDRLYLLEQRRRTEAALKEAQRVGRLGSWEWDARTDAITWSEESYRLFNFDPTQPLPGYGTHLKLYAPASAARLDAAVKRCLETGEPYAVDLELARPDGPCRWVTARSEARRNASGEVVGLRGTVQDISTRKQAEEELRASEERYRTLVEQASDGIFIAGADGRYVDVNASGCRMLGYSREQILQLNMREVVAAANQAAAPLRFQELRSGQSVLTERDLIRQDGTLLPVEISGTQLADGRFLGFVRDITERRHAEAALRRRADEFAALYATARELAAQQDLPWLLERIIARALELIPARGALIALYDADSDNLEISLVRGLSIPPGTRLRRSDGLVGRVAQTGKPIIVDDYSTWEGHLTHFETILVGPTLAAPMLSGGDLIGVLVLSGAQEAGHSFSPAEADLLMLLAGYAASAAHNARTLEQAEARAAQLALVYDAGLALNSQLEPQVLLEFLARITGQALRATVVEFFRFDDRFQTLQLELSVGHSAAGQARLKEVGSQVAGENSLAAAVARTRLPLNVPDLNADVRYVAAEPDLRAGLWVPVHYQDHLRGVLGVLCPRPGAFSDRDEQLLMLFANQTAVALQNARLFAETERQLHRIEALRKVDIAISSNLELRPILNALLEQSMRELGVDAAAILLLDPHQRQLEYIASRGFRTADLDKTHRPAGDGLAGQVLQRRRVVALPDLTESRGGLLKKGLLADEGFAAYFAAPLLFRGRVKGIFELFHRAPLKPEGEWLDFLETLAAQAALAIENIGLFDDLQRSNAELAEAYDATIEGWSRALDLRDEETEGHSQRVTELTLALAAAMGVSGQALVHIRRGALLHDIGKMGVPDAILLKPGPLNAEEWDVMRRHPVFAYEMLSPIDFLRPALDIPYCHHEKWDGSGYPRGLQGEQIPLAARIFSAVDVYDALRSSRPYRPAWSEAKVRDYLEAEAGRHFDTDVIRFFLEMLNAR